MTIYLLQGLGWSPLVVAAVLIPGALARVAASSVTSRVYARLGPRTLPVGLGIQAAATIGLVLVSTTLDGVAFSVA